jgi:hypothetical protein
VRTPAENRRIVGVVAAAVGAMGAADSGACLRDNVRTAVAARS